MAQEAKKEKARGTPYALVGHDCEEAQETAQEDQTSWLGQDKGGWARKPESSPQPHQAEHPAAGDRSEGNTAGTTRHTSKRNMTTCTAAHSALASAPHPDSARSGPREAGQKTRMQRTSHWHTLQRIVDQGCSKELEDLVHRPDEWRQFFLAKGKLRTKPADIWVSRPLSILGWKQTYQAIVVHGRRQDVAPAYAWWALALANPIINATSEIFQLGKGWCREKEYSR